MRCDELGKFLGSTKEKKRKNDSENSNLIHVTFIAYYSDTTFNRMRILESTATGRAFNPTKIYGKR